MPLDYEPRDWRRELAGVTLLCSTNKEYIQLDALNAALASDLMWWAREMPQKELETMLGNSLCFGLYLVGSNDTMRLPDKFHADKDAPVMIGFARVITDYATFGYLTDVYILEEHQGKGFGSWMMRCINETVDGIPSLRRLLLLTQSRKAAKMYERTLGAVDWMTSPSKDLTLLQKVGPARKMPPPE